MTSCNNGAQRDRLLLYGGLTVGLVPDGITFLSGLKTVAMGQGLSGPTTASEAPILVGNAILSTHLIGYQVNELSTNPEYQAATNTDHHLRQTANLLAGRSISLHIPPMAGWLSSGHLMEES